MLIDLDGYEACVETGAPSKAERVNRYQAGKKTRETVEQSLKTRKPKAVGVIPFVGADPRGNGDFDGREEGQKAP